MKNANTNNMRNSFVRSNQQHLGIDKPTHTDVCLGRGVGTNRHAGNTYFRGIVSQHVEEYLNSTKTQKMVITRRVIDHIKNLSPPGRFLEKDADTGKWNEADLKRAHEKTAQALRDGAARLRSSTRPASNDQIIIAEQLARPAKKQRIQNGGSVGVIIQHNNLGFIQQAAQINHMQKEEEEVELLDIDELISEMYSPIFSSDASIDAALIQPPACPISPCPSGSTHNSHDSCRKDSFDCTFGGLPFHTINCGCKDKEEYDEVSMMGFDNNMVDMRDEDIFRLWMTC